MAVGRDFTAVDRAGARVGTTDQHRYMTRTPRQRQDSGPAATTRGAAAAPAIVEIPEVTKPALRVHLRLATCRNLLMREARRSVERWGLTLPQFDVLAELSRAVEQGFTFVELSRLLLVTSGNLTGIVDRLENDGLVRRETDDRDRRLVRIVLTRKGRQLVEQIMPLHATDIHSLLEFMSVDQLASLNEMLGQLREGLRSRSLLADGADAPASVDLVASSSRRAASRVPRENARKGRRAKAATRHAAATRLRG
jgi:DNA-binding MarR family transcriptional regulator